MQCTKNASSKFYANAILINTGVVPNNEQFSRQDFALNYLTCGELPVSCEIADIVRFYSRLAGVT